MQQQSRHKTKPTTHKQTTRTRERERQRSEKTFVDVEVIEREGAKDGGTAQQFVFALSFVLKTNVMFKSVLRYNATYFVPSELVVDGN